MSNDENFFDLRYFREKILKMSQEEFAKLIGVRQDVVSRMEKDPSQITLSTLKIIAEKTGTTLDELVGYEKPIIKALQVEYSWGTVDFTRKTLADYIENFCQQSSLNSDYHQYVNELKIGIHNLIQKPKIAIIGRSDVGKSALINSLLGKEKMPTAWTPTTSIVVYLKHISDKPSYMSDDVWVFRSSNNGEADWDDRLLYDEKYCTEWKLASGDIGLLKSYGTRFGEKYDQNEAGSAVAFIDSDILRNCDIMDLPGFGTGDRAEDDIVTLEAKKKADVLIYMSIANGFMRDEDIQYLKEAIPSLNIIEANKEYNIEPLSNLFIVASQAHTVDKGNSMSLQSILDKGCERFERTLSDGFWRRRKEVSGYDYNHDIFRSRFFTYTSDIGHLRIDFENSLREVMELLPRIVEKRVKSFVQDFSSSKCNILKKAIDSYYEIIKEKKAYEEMLKQITQREPERFSDNQNHRISISTSITNYRDISLRSFAEKYKRIISVDNIVHVIESKGYKKKKEDIQLLSSYINSCLQDEMQDILKSNSELLKNEINDYISAFETRCKLSDMSSVNLNYVPFNATRAFASGLAGLATFGGLAIWASTLGNLGAYILVAKGVSLLSSLGISVGGTAAAATAVASIGGPVVLGIALAVIAALSVFAVFSRGWQKGIGKKLVSAYEENDALRKFNESIIKFWDDTQTAFNASADSLETEWQAYIANLKSIVKNDDINDIKKRIDEAKNIKDFFENIPL